MLTDFADSQDFYQSRTGRAAQGLLRARIGKRWSGLANGRVLPLGRAALVLDETPFISARMTGAQEETFSCLVDSKNKPLPDADIDRAIMLHALKAESDLEPVLREIWRVLKGEGRLLMVLPRAGSAWARNPDTPFGHEPAYTASQIKKILKRHGFFVARMNRALYARPCAPEPNFLRALEIERAAPGIFLRFGGGVLLVEARKRICGIAGAKQKKRPRCANPLLPLPLPI
jgi:SAM-dependent methyltransferase